MYRISEILAVALLAAALAPALPATAQEPAPGAPPTPAPAPQPTTSPAQVAPAEAGLSSQAQELANLDANLALAMKRLQIGTTQVQQQEVDRQLGAVRTGVNTVPELVGVSGTARTLVAEFLTGTGILRVREGDWITNDWRVQSLSPSAVVLARRGGQATTINFGHRPSSAADLARDLREIGGAGAEAAPGGGVVTRQMPMPGR